MNKNVPEDVIVLLCLISLAISFSVRWILKPTKIITVDRPVNGDTVVVYSDISDICTKSGGKFQQKYDAMAGWNGDWTNIEIGYAGIDGSASCTKNGIRYDYSGNGQFTSETTNILK